MLFFKSSTLTSNSVMWFQKPDLDKLNNRLLLYSILQS